MIQPSQAFAGLPTGLRDELMHEYNGIVRNFREGRWGPAELDGGRLAEVVYSILRGHVDETFPAAASKPKNMVKACADLASAPEPPFTRSVRTLIPRTLIALYDFRNNRDAGHVGGDVDSNHMDAAAVLAMSKWVVAELVRLFHGTDTATASAIVDSLTAREIPLVWEYDGRKTVLSVTVGKTDAALLLLSSSALPVSVAMLSDWMEAKHMSNFRRDVILPLHAQKLALLDPKTDLVHLTPIGVRRVEDELLRQASA